VRQVLTNLVGNALKFTREGRVGVRVSVDGEGEESVVRFEIEDTGIGIPPDKLDRIFEKFAQADASTTRKFGGTGLGLSISRQLVELMGGTMTVTSVVDRGSTFAFTIPLAACAGVPAQLPRDLPLSGLRLLHVSVDGMPDPAIASLLIAEGLRVVEAAPFLPPSEALLAAEADHLPFQFVLIEGEEMSVEVQQTIRTCRRDLWPALAIVVLIRRGYRGLASHARLAGADACLVAEGPAHDLREALAVARQVVQGGLTWPLITRHWLLEARAGEEGQDTAESDRVSATGTRVLVTDDNELNRLVASEYLRRQGADVETAASGAAAVARVAEGGIQLVFMDCQMPELDGYETTARIRALGGELGQVPVVAMTANAMQGDRERCLAAGMNDYVSKPIREGDVSRMLRRWGATVPAPRGAPAASAAGPVSGPIRGGALGSLASSGPGGADLAARLTTLYLRETPMQLQALRTAAVTRDWPTAARMAHTLRGASGVMGALGVVEMCQGVEHAASRESLDDMLEAIDVLDREAARALRALGGAPLEGPALDPAKLEEYHRLDEESPGICATVFQLFLRDAPERVTAIEAGLATEDWEAVRRAAHSLRGTALQLGARVFGEIVADIEAAAKREDAAAARGGLPAMVREWDRVREALRRELGPVVPQVTGVS
jgi:CheY-like chemotaxis protein